MRRGSEIVALAGIAGAVAIGVVGILSGDQGALSGATGLIGLIVGAAFGERRGYRNGKAANGGGP